LGLFERQHTARQREPCATLTSRELYSSQSRQEEQGWMHDKDNLISG